MLRIDEACDTAALLDLCDHMQGNGCLTAGFGSVYLNDPALGDSALSERKVKADGTGGDGLNLHLCAGISQSHDGSLSVLLLNLSESRFKGLFLFSVYIIVFHEIPFHVKKRTGTNVRINNRTFVLPCQPKKS